MIKLHNNRILFVYYWLGEGEGWGGGQIIELYVNWYTGINQCKWMFCKNILSWNVVFQPGLSNDSCILLYVFLVSIYISGLIFFLSNPYKWCKPSFNIYFFSSHCVPTSLLSLYRLFPCYESVYMLNDILFESLANTISNTSSDLKCCL